MTRPLSCTLGVVAIAAAAAAAALFTATSAQAAYTLSFSTSGSVGPSDPMACANPFAGCPLTATGIATALAGNLAPLPVWNLTAVFSLSLPPLSPTTFATSGTFTLDDPTAADDDLFGDFLGVFDAAGFFNNATYVITGGSGRFAGMGGTGHSLIEINPQTFEFSERGRLSIPETGTALLAALALLGLARSRRARG